MELAGSLTDVAWLLKKCSLSSLVIVLSDFNIDMLPVLLSDPYVDHPNYMARPREERTGLYALAEAFRLDILVADACDSSLGDRTTCACRQRYQEYHIPSMTLKHMPVV